MSPEWSHLGTGKQPCNTEIRRFCQALDPLLSFKTRS